MSAKPEPGASDPLLRVVENLSRFHREHEKHYSEEPLEAAIRLSRVSSTLKALAEHWSVAPVTAPTPSPYAGAEDLNDDRAIEQAGVLFMEGAGEPVEITELKHDLQALADGQERASEWLSEAMENSWAMAEALTPHAELADLLGERHRIIVNNWRFAQTMGHSARLLRRALRLLDEIDFSPEALRSDLDDRRAVPRYLFSAAELVDLAADLLARGAGLERDNERRWRGKLSWSEISEWLSCP